MKRNLIISEGIKKAWEPFNDAVPEYVKRIQTYHNVSQNQDLKPEAIQRHRVQTKTWIREELKKCIDKALLILQATREAYTGEKPEPPKYTDTQRLCNLTLWTNILPTADIDELREMYNENKHDPDFMKLLNAEFKKRPDELSLQRFKHEIEHGTKDPALNELEKTEKALNNLLAMKDVFPVGLKNGLSNLKFRSINEDLNAVPISDGATYRPVFSVRED